MKTVHEGDTLVVWKLDRLARSARQLIDTVDALPERRRVLKSDRRARHDDPRGRLSSTYSAAAEGMLADPNRQSRHDRAARVAC